MSTSPNPDEVSIVVVAGGPLGTPPKPELLPASPSAIIAADSGLDRALAFGLTPTLLVGDLDSVSTDGRAWVEANGIPTQEHPQDKDQTDLELAMDVAMGDAKSRPDTIVVVATAAGRLDHALANLMLLASDAYVAVRVVGLIDDSIVHVVRGSVAIAGQPEDLVTLVPLAGAVHGVTTDGLSWPLTDASLALGSSHGVSNRMLGTEATVAVSGGCLAVIQSFEP